MAVPSYDELLSTYGVQSYEMKQALEDNHVTKFSFKMDRWEKLARSLELPIPDIERLKREGDYEEQKDKMLESWRQRCGSKATYEVLTRALLQINRTDMAEEVVKLRLSLRDRDDHKSAAATGQITFGTESSLVTPLSPVSSSGVEDMSPSTSPTSWTTATSVQPAVDIAPTLQQLEDDFCELVMEVEVILNKNDVGLNNITRRFSMLPQSVKRRYQTDKDYKETKRKILESTTIKTLFDNLTDLKHWNFMMPDTLAYILKDVKIDDIHQKIDKYKEKLSNFKMKTKLKDLISTRFPVPEYCIELTMEAKGWEDKTIEEAEKAVGNIMRCAAYGQHVPLGWKGVEPGSMKLTFILLESIKITPDVSLDAICRKHTGIMNIKLDGDVKLYINIDTESKETASGNRELLSKNLWYSTEATEYGVGGRGDVLIISADLPRHQPEAVARRPGQLTEEDKQKLLSQGVTSDCQSEVDIVRARCELHKDCRMVDVLSGKLLTREDVLKRITHHLNATKNDGVSIYYIGAGRKGSGDWCFEDGFITFRDIAQLYLQSKLRGRVLTIVSDCSYSGRWVRDCMEFLDEQGVQPCGHKAREKGIIVRIFTSCQRTEIPTEYRFSVSGLCNDKNTAEMSYTLSSELLETQTTCGIDPSATILCKHKSIDEPCTLDPGYTWKRILVKRRIICIPGTDHGRPMWQYILLEDDDNTIRKFKENIHSVSFYPADYGKILFSGWGTNPPKEVEERIEEFVRQK